MMEFVLPENFNTSNSSIKSEPPEFIEEEELMIKNEPIFDEDEG